MFKNVIIQLLRKLEKYKSLIQKDWEGKMQIEPIRSGKIYLLIHEKKVKILKETVK